MVSGGTLTWIQWLWLLVSHGECHDLGSNGIVVIAYLAMNGDMMLHMRNAMWIHCLICWNCKWLLYLLALQMLLSYLLELRMVVIFAGSANVVV